MRGCQGLPASAANKLNHLFTCVVIESGMIIQHIFVITLLENRLE